MTDDEKDKTKPPSTTTTSTTKTTKTTTNKTNKTNIIVMSDAGKPIFARFGTEEEVSRLCGLIQAVRTAINNNSTSSTLRLGEIQSLQSNNLSMVFMTVGSITLLSISSKSNSTDVIETESFCRLRLEYVYAQLIFTLTEQVQTIFVHNPSFDLRSTMSSSESLLRGILDKSGPDQDLGLFLMAGVQSLYPISHRVRHKASLVLQSAAGRPENNIAFALLVAGRVGGGDKLLTVVQPSYRPHQLRISDLHLILNFVGKQQQPSSSGLGVSSELWVPMCLPRFNSNGFLYAYISCLDVPSQLTLLLLSSHGTPEQFQILRSSSQQIRNDLGLPQVSDSVLRIVATSSDNNDDQDDENDDDDKDNADDDKDNDDDNHDDVAGDSVPPTATVGSDVGWTRNEESTSFDDDYVNISIHGNEVVVEKDDLLYQVRHATELSTMEHICKKYLDDEESLIHFLFRLDIPVAKGGRPRHGRGPTHHHHHPHPSASGGGNLSQCISPTIDNEPYCDSSFRRRLWCNYQELSLRLRLGSATVESAMDAYDMINASCREDEEEDERAKPGGGQQQQQQHGHFPGIGKHCPTMGLFESPPYNPDGLSYIIQGDETFLAMNGKNFELYMATTNSVPVKRAAAIGTKLVRCLTSDEKSLFLCKPLTWRD